MRTLMKAVLVSLLAVPISGCQEPHQIPADMRAKTIDPKSAVAESDTIVLAYPVSQRDIRQFLVPSESGSEKQKLAETETTLRVLQILKGTSLPSEIRFRYYDARSYIQIGPPQGPSGHMNSRGIFFLKQHSEAFFRTAVDVYRPDIATPWLQGLSGVEACDQAAACIAKILLTYHPSDDARSFSASLLEGVAISRQLTGFLSTYDLLNGLASDVTHPAAVRQAACRELSKWYALELPAGCSIVIAGTPAAQDYSSLVTKLQDGLRKGGMPWIQHRIGTDDTGEVKRYLELLKSDGDADVRASVQKLLDQIP
jgi:hypothetical protein